MTRRGDSAIGGHAVASDGAANKAMLLRPHHPGSLAFCGLWIGQLAVLTNGVLAAPR
jgi:hypothetical protein